MRTEALAFSGQGLALGQRLSSAVPGFTVQRCPEGGLAGWTHDHFGAPGLVFIGSVGIAVRAVAAELRSKTCDPAVVVIDEQARFCIPVLSGHIGGANQLALKLAASCGAVPVITTATDSRGLFAVDSWAREQQLWIANPELIKRVSGKLLAGETIWIGSRLPITGERPQSVQVLDPNSASPQATDPAFDVVISPSRRVPVGALHLVPPIITAGVGARRGISEHAVCDAIEAALDRAGLHPLSLAGLATIDLKADEAGLLDYAQESQLPVQTFTADQLNSVAGTFTASQFVSRTTGVDCVCERAAVAGGGDLIAKKTALRGVTVALGQTHLQLAFEGEIDG